jgi:DNA-binding LacI/PurR family transcriptional regulator/DNA-binding transcriptional regulator YhcF (GntR family)
VIEALRFELTRPPAAAGQRLINERQLAQMLGANRMTIRRSLDELEKQGLIIRRHGSGTYIRKIPTSATCPVDYQPTSESIVVTEMMEDQPSRLQPDPTKKQLTLGLWGDMHCTTQANKLLLEGITQQVSNLNHRLHMCCLEYAEDGLTRIENIVDELEKVPCDGYIVNSNLVDHFIDAYHKVWGQSLPPLVQVWPGTILPTFEPLIQTDSMQAIERATCRLIEQGYRHITYVGMMGHIGPTARTVLGYQLAMQSAGLKLQREVRLQSIMHLDCQWKPVLKALLDGPHCPEAICMSTENPLPVLYELMCERGIKPGRDIGIITVANEGIALPQGEDWSTMVFHPRMVGNMAVNSLVDVIGTAGQKLCSFSHQANWRPGKTHLRHAD